MKRNFIALTAPVFYFLLLCTSFRPAFLDGAEWAWHRAVQVEHKPVLDVPYVPTPAEVVNSMLELAGVNSKDTLYDLGCGDGRIVVTAAKERKIRKGIGIDIDPERIRESNENAQKSGVNGRVTFIEKSLFEIDVKEATVVSLYLLPSVNMQLRPKLLHDLKPGARIVSHDFDMGDWQPDQTAQINGHTVYYWVVPANVNGTWTWTFSDGERTHTAKMQLRQHFQNVYNAELKIDGIDSEIANIRLTGDRLEFGAGGGTSILKNVGRFSGTIKAGSMKGTVSFEQNGQERKSAWTAERKEAKPMPLDNSSGASIHL